MKLKKLFLSGLLALALNGTTQTSLSVVAGTEGITWETNMWEGNAINNLTVYKGELYFAADHGSFGPGLFKIDTDDNVVHVADIDPAVSFEGYPTELTAVGGKLLFSCSDGVSGEELWEYDGINPPVLVGDIETGFAGSFPSELTQVGSKLYFSAYTASEGRELYMYDGSGAPTMIWNNPGVVDINIRYTIAYLDSAIVFKAQDASLARDIWMMDTITNTPVRISEFYETNVFNLFGDIGIYEENIIFGYDNGSIGSELYQYDGSGPASLLADINETGGGVSGSSVSIANYTEHDGILYFMAQDSPINTELWQYDGVSAPSLVEDTNPAGQSYLFDIVSFKGSLIMGSDHVWEIDASGELNRLVGDSIVLLEDIIPGTFGSNPQDFVIHNDKLYFIGYYDGGGNAVYVYDQDFVVAGVEDENLNGIAKELLVYPNPVNERLTIRLAKQTTATEILIYDMTGSLVHSELTGNSNKTTIDVSHFGAGTYSVIVKSDKGVDREKFIKM